MQLIARRGGKREPRCPCCGDPSIPALSVRIARTSKAGFRRRRVDSRTWVSLCHNVSPLCWVQEGRQGGVVERKTGRSGSSVECRCCWVSCCVIVNVPRRADGSVKAAGASSNWKYIRSSYKLQATSNGWPVVASYVLRQCNSM